MHVAHRRPWTPQGRPILYPGQPAHPDVVNKVDTFDPARAKTTAFIRNEAVMRYWIERGMDPSRIQPSPVTLQKLKVSHDAPTATTWVPKTQRDELKYKAQRSNIVFGFYDPFSGREKRVTPPTVTGPALLAAVTTPRPASTSASASASAPATPAPTARPATPRA